MRNIKFLFVCGLLLFSAIALAQEEGDDGTDVDVSEGEEPLPESPPEEPSAEPIPDGTADTGTCFRGLKPRKVC